MAAVTSLTTVGVPINPTFGIVMNTAPLIVETGVPMRDAGLRGLSHSRARVVQHQHGLVPSKLRWSGGEGGSPS
jgi:hypothetical protein